MRAAANAYITTNIVGGLGNQLFLIANLLATARRNNLQAFLVKEEWSSSCEAPRPTYWHSVFAHLFDKFDVLDGLPPGLQQPMGGGDGCSVVEVREERPLQPITLPVEAKNGPNNKVYRLVGFFQSEALFHDYPVIKDVIPVSLLDLSESTLCKHYGRGTFDHVVGMHIRRGDYVRMTHTFSYLQLEYYDIALQRLLGRTLLASSRAGARCAVLIFCDEESEGALAAGYFRAKYPRLAAVTYVHPRREGKEEGREGGTTCPREVLELLMLSQCDDIIIANSTFSWWSAYLSEQPLRRVVAPSKWFENQHFKDYSHLYGDSWIIL